MAGHVGRMGESKNAYRILVGEHLEKLPPCRLRRLEDEVKIYLKEVGCENGRCVKLNLDHFS
jgi:hypothetical protein